MTRRSRTTFESLHSKRKNTMLRTSILLAAALAAGFATDVHARQAGDVPDFLHYQARLLNAFGNPVNNPNLPAVFNFYEVPVGGPSKHTANATLNVVNGLVSTKIDVPVTLFATSKPLYIGITLGADPEMTPRFEIGSAGYAHRADSAKATTSAVPPGAILATAAANAPAGYLICDGAAVSRTTYADLFAVISTTYGAGDGSTTFNLPDLRQRFPLGKAVSGTGAVLGQAGGAIDHAHSLPNHNHSLPNHAHNIPDHAHVLHGHYHNKGLLTVMKDALDNASGFGNGTIARGQAGGATSPMTMVVSGKIGSTSPTAQNGDGDITTEPASISTNPAGAGNTGNGGSGTSGTANPPFLTVNYLIKT